MFVERGCQRREVLAELGWAERTYRNPPGRRSFDNPARKLLQNVRGMPSANDILANVLPVMV